MVSLPEVINFHQDAVEMRFLTLLTEMDNLRAKLNDTMTHDFKTLKTALRNPQLFISSYNDVKRIKLLFNPLSTAKSQKPICLENLGYNKMVPTFFNKSM